MSAEVKGIQRTANRFTNKYLRGVKPLEVDGNKGHSTNSRIEMIKWYLGYGKDRDSSWHPLTVRRVRHPRSLKYSSAKMIATGIARRRRQKKNATKHPDDEAWGGSRYFTNIAVDIALSMGTGLGRRKWSGAPINGNWGSDHNVWNTRADAADLPTFNGQPVAERIAHELGVSYKPNDWNISYVQRNGKTYRVQILWYAPDGSHRDHVHVGAHVV